MCILVESNCSIAYFALALVKLFLVFSGSIDFYFELLALSDYTIIVAFLAVSDEKPLSKEEKSLLTKVLRAKLVESTKEVEVQRKDPNSPLYSVKSFEELPL